MTRRPRRTTAPRARRVAAAIHRADRRSLAWSVRRRSAVTDRALTVLSGAANNGKLWYATAVLLAVTGRRRQRTAAVAGLASLGATSALVNGPLKFLWQRDRPASDALGLAGTLLPLPRTYSFPSGHSASAFAFTTAVSSAYPPAAPAVLPLAAAVAYSRVHTGVHFPSDVVAGSAIGAGVGALVSRAVVRAREAAVRPCDAPAVNRAIPSRVVVLRNGNSGAASSLDAARTALRRGGIDVDEEVDVRDLDRLRKLVGESDDDLLVLAAGGDGTVGAAADAVSGTSAVLGILPLGTSNDVARSLGVPPDAAEAASALADGEIVAVDAGLVELADGTTRTFVNAATAGLNVAFAKLATTSRMRDRFGGLTYPVSAALALRRHQPFRCTVEHDGRRRDLEIVHLSVSNATVFGGVLGMRVPGADIADGLLDVIVIERLSVARLLLALGDTAIGRHTPVHRVHSLQVRTLQISADSEQQVAVDGEVVGSLPATFRVRPASLQVLIPQRR